MLGREVSLAGMLVAFRIGGSAWLLGACYRADPTNNPTKRNHQPECIMHSGKSAKPSARMRAPGRV